MGISKSFLVKTFVLVIAISVAIGSFVGVTIAFFTGSHESTGVYTLGNVYVSVTEAAVKDDGSGNLIEDTDAPRIHGADTTEGGLPTLHNYGIVFPGQTIRKDPTIKNVGDTNAYGAAKVVIEDGTGDIHRLYKYNDYYDDIDIERLLSGGLLDEFVYVGDWMGNEAVCYNDRYAMVQIANRAAGRYEFYFLMLGELAPEESVMLFDTFFLNGLFGNNEMMEFKDFRITVEAFATQTNGFDSCFEAMTTAFPKHFSNIKH